MRLKKATSEIGGKSGKCNVTEAKRGKKKKKCFQEERSVELNALERSDEVKPENCMLHFEDWKIWLQMEGLFWWNEWREIQLETGVDSREDGLRGIEDNPLR